MKKTKLLIFLFFFFFSNNSLSFLEATFLKPSDTKSILQHLLSNHIDEKQINTSLLLKGLSCYLNNFDPMKIYFTEEEASSFININSKKANSLIKEYNQGNFGQYFLLNEKIKHNILRARSWRKTWISEAKKMVSEALQYDLEGNNDIPKIFSKNYTELKERHRKNFIALISFYLKDNEKNKYLGKEQQLVKLCEKQLIGVENTYLGLEDFNTPLKKEQEQHNIVIRIIKSLASSLDAHTAYFSKEEALAIKAQLEKGMCGIGIVLRDDINGVIVKEIIKGGPADISKNLFPGDVIVSVNKKSIQGLPFTKVLQILKGEENSLVILGIKTTNNSFKEITLKRNNIIIEDKRVDVSYEPFSNGIIGKITLHSFYENGNGVSSEQDLKKAIANLKTKNLLGLVLDIRDNSGGFLSQAIKVSGLFMKNGVVVISKYSNGTKKVYRTFNKDKFYSGPLVVLVSKTSASASEIVAQTLQDYQIAVIAGDEHTYGKGTIQHQTLTEDSDSNFLFKVTVGKYYTVSGKSTQIEGVKSDIVIPSRQAYEKIGERFLENPIPNDSCKSLFEDNLDDLCPASKKWLKKQYLSNLQQKEMISPEDLSLLKRNSSERLSLNKNFQIFKESLETRNKKQVSYGQNDLQLDEAVNIVKDLITLKQLKKTEN